MKRINAVILVGRLTAPRRLEIASSEADTCVFVIQLPASSFQLPADAIHAEVERRKAQRLADQDPERSEDK